MKKFNKETLVFTLAISLWCTKTTDLFSSNMTDTKKTTAQALETARSVANTTDPIQVVEKAKDDLNQIKALDMLKKYETLHEKVFLTDSEKQFKHDLLNNVDSIQNMKAILLQPVKIIGSDEDVQRNLALDFLIEASSMQNSKEATQALLDIIQDQQIEDDHLNVNDRQSIADIKAEILYIWTAKKPDQIEMINQIIPGPVTAQLWKNAQDAWEQNQFESNH